MRGVIFLSSKFVLGFGHVGWGFEESPGVFCFGATEIATNSLEDLKKLRIEPGQQNWAFIARGDEKQMFEAMRTGEHEGSRFPYDPCVIA